MTITNWIVGTVVGLIIALILVLILQNTVFKDSNMKILYAVIFILFAIFGGLVQNKICSVSADALPTSQEQIEEIDKTINWFTQKWTQKNDNERNVILFQNQTKLYRFCEH